MTFGFSKLGPILANIETKKYILFKTDSRYFVYLKSFSNFLGKKQTVKSNRPETVSHAYVVVYPKSGFDKLGI